MSLVDLVAKVAPNVDLGPNVDLAPSADPVRKARVQKVDAPKVVVPKDSADLVRIADPAVDPVEIVVVIVDADPVAIAAIVVDVPAVDPVSMALPWTSSSRSSSPIACISTIRRMPS